MCPFPFQNYVSHSPKMVRSCFIGFDDTVRRQRNDSHQRQIRRQKLSEQAFLLLFPTSVTSIFKIAFHTLTDLNMMPTI